MSINNEVDKPLVKIDEDELEIKPYVKGLANFLKECDTPMAVSIQGEWGCGKTSVISLICQYHDIVFENPDGGISRDKRIKVILVDAWEYVQFNNATNISVAFMECILSKLSDKNDVMNIAKMRGILSEFAVGMVKDKFGDTVGNATEKLVTGIFEDSFSKKMHELRNGFKKAFEEYDQEGKRVIIYIDNLDRIAPAMAVEFIEIAKLFFDVCSCIFVMTIDSEVVFQGIKDKYGDSIDDKKARAFFDKIIQLPFQLPVSKYKWEKMLEHLFGDALDFANVPQSDKDWYCEVIYHFTKGIPRSLKRLKNFYLLEQSIWENISENAEGDLDNFTKKINFWKTAFNMCYPEQYNQLLVNLDLKLCIMLLASGISVDEFKNNLMKGNYYRNELLSDEVISSFLLLNKMLINSDHYNSFIIDNAFILREKISGDKMPVFDDLDSKDKLVDYINKFEKQSNKSIDEFYLMNKIRLSLEAIGYHAHYKSAISSLGAIQHKKDSNVNDSLKDMSYVFEWEGLGKVFSMTQYKVRDYKNNVNKLYPPFVTVTLHNINDIDMDVLEDTIQSMLKNIKTVYEMSHAYKGEYGSLKDDFNKYCNIYDQNTNMSSYGQIYLYDENMVNQFIVGMINLKNKLKELK